MTRENRILLLLAALVLLTFLAALRLGSLNLSTLEVWQGLWNDRHDQHFAVWNNRLPRALLAIAGRRCGPCRWWPLAVPPSPSPC